MRRVPPNVMRRLVIAYVAAASAALGAQGADQAVLNRARAIHDRVVTLDTHVDIEPAYFTPACNYTQRLTTQVNLPKMRAGGLDAAFMVVNVQQGPLTAAGYASAYADAVRRFDAIHRLVETFAPGRTGLALTADDVARIASTGRTVVMIGIENGYPVGLDVAKLREFHARGGRYMSLAHNGRNQLSGSHTEDTAGEATPGLTPLGRDVITEMNRLGMMVDVSHASRAAMLQAVAHSAAPVIASHSSMRALADHSRNLDDEQLRAIKAKGGVVQVVAYAAYIEEGTHSGRAPLRTVTGGRASAPCQVEKPGQAPLSVEGRPGVSAFVDHIDHAVKTIGIDHVGIASDFDGAGGIEGWDSAADTFNVTLELVRRGYDEVAIAQLWGGNLLRVWREVETVAARLQAGGR